MDQMQIRHATLDDVQVLYEMANDPTVRAHAFQSDPISWETHLAWFLEKMKNPDARIYIIESSQGGIAGQVRYDRRDDASWIDISVACEQRGQGLGTRALVETRSLARRDLGTRCFRANVLESNTPSRRIFENAGYTQVATESSQGKSYIVYAANLPEGC